jgi:hypothetical protein
VAVAGEIPIFSVTVTEELPDLLASETLAAVIVIVEGLGTTAGAVYSPVAEIVPAGALPPAVPLTDQVAD